MTLDVQKMIEVTVREDASALPDLGRVQHRVDGRRRRRAVGRCVGAAAVAALVVVGAVAMVESRDRDGDAAIAVTPGSTTTAPSTTNPSTTVQSSTATTLPSDGTLWHTAATAWTGTEYLVWGGQASSDGTGRADGWRHDPTTGETRAIPVAPIAPRDQAAGAWTGTELVVCCGLPVGDGPAYDTASAAAYDPATDRWRALAPPPPETAGSTLGAVWTGNELLVVSAVQGAGYRTVGLLLHAYDPATDVWSRRADAPGGDRVGHLVWTGEELIVWTTGFTSSPGHDLGQRYDPASDTWTALPELPDAHRPWYASAAWVDDQLVVWGNDQGDELTTVGYRWRPGDDAWRPMSDAPVRIENWGEGTPGSQTFAVDPDSGRLLVVSVHPGAEGAGSDMRPLLAYDPVADRWEVLGEASALGHGTGSALVADGHVLQPDRAAPVAFDVPT